MDELRYDVAVVGAGQAGLAIGHALAEQKRRFVVADDAAFIARQFDDDGEPSARRSTDSAPQAARATEGAI